ncbi:MAG: hypothetical protein O6944_02910 [Gammaproteobacteria bacterium]|nr:hypothetical protein [Gammaproteobacteria bacterium]
MNEDNAPSFRQAPRNTGAACVWVLLVACLSAPAWAGGQSAAGFVLYEGLKEQFTLELPQGWHVFNQSGSPEYGVVVFSALSMRIEAEGMDEAALGAKVRKRMAQVDSGELPSFFVDRYPIKRGMSCDGLSKKARKKMLRVLTRATAFGGGSKLLNRPEAEPISLGGCQGLKVLVRAQTAEGREFVMLIYTVSHGQTTYDFALRNRKEYFEKNRPVFEKALSTLKITKLRFPKAQVDSLLAALAPPTLPKTFDRIVHTKKPRGGAGSFGTFKRSGTLTIDENTVEYVNKKHKVAIPFTALRSASLEQLGSLPAHVWLVIDYEDNGEAKSIGFQPHAIKGNRGDLSKMHSTVKYILREKGPIERVRFDFDGRKWSEGYSDQIVKEFVLPGETVENWTELVTIQTFPGMQTRMTAKKLMLRFKKKITRKDCPDVMWNVITESEEEVVYEWRTIDCPGWDNQYEVSKVIRGKTGIHRSAYTNRELPISEDQRNRWIDLIGSVKLEMEQR